MRYYYIKPQSKKERDLKRYLSLGLTPREIGLLLGTSAGTIQNTLHRLEIERGDDND